MSTTTVDPAGCAHVRAAMAEVRAAQMRLVQSVARLEASGAAAASGYRGPKRLVEDLCRVDPAHAGRLLADAHSLVPAVTLTGEAVVAALPTLAALAQDGIVGEQHVRVVSRAMDAVERIPGLHPETVAAAEAALAGHAEVLAPRGVEKAAARLLAHLDPDGVAPIDPPEPDDEMSLRRRSDGTLTFSGLIHAAADGELLLEVIDALAVPAGPDDTRSLSRRRAEALLDLAAQALAGSALPDTDVDPASPSPASSTDRPASGHAEPDGHAEQGTEAGQVGHAEPAGHAEPDGHAEQGSEAGHAEQGTEAGQAEQHGYGTEAERGGQEPASPSASASATRRRPASVTGRALLTLTIDLRWLRDGTGHALLDSGATLSASAARRLACDAGLVPAVLGARSEPLDVGRLSYVAPDALRRALHLRDRGCSFPACTRRPRRCHVHHIRHWSEGGSTDPQNTTLLCRFHHHLVHHGGWSIEMVQGRPWYTPPRWIDPSGRPRPGGPHPPDTTAAPPPVPTLAVAA